MLAFSDKLPTNYYHIIHDFLCPLLTHGHKTLYLESKKYDDLFKPFVKISHTPKDLEYVGKSCNLPLLVKKMNTLRPKLKPLHKIIYKVRTGKRHVINDNEIIQAIRQYWDVEVVDFDGKSFREQIKMMNGCLLFVGCHGAGFTNTLFMDSGSNVLEFFPESFYTDCFEEICKEKKINHYYLHGTSIKKPPLTLKKYKSVMKTKKYNNPIFRSSIRDVPFTMDVELVINKMKEILQ